MANARNARLDTLSISSSNVSSRISIVRSTIMESVLLVPEGTSCTSSSASPIRPAVSNILVRTVSNANPPTLSEMVNASA